MCHRYLNENYETIHVSNFVFLRSSSPSKIGKTVEEETNHKVEEKDNEVTVKKEAEETSDDAAKVNSGYVNISLT